MKTFLSFTAQTIFWLWNLVFLGIAYLGVVPTIAVPLATATMQGIVPLDLTLSLLTLSVIPMVCTIVGARYFITSPLQLLRLFYGVEAPLVALCLLRLFLVREITLASGQILITGLVAIAAFAVELFISNTDRQKLLTTPKQKFWAGLQFVGQNITLIVGLYVGLLMLFYAVPIGWTLLVGFFSFSWVPELGRIITQSFTIWSLWWMPIMVLLFFFSSALFVLMPFFLSGLYINSWRRVALSYVQRQGRIWAIAGSGLVLTLWLGGFIACQFQPQTQAFALVQQSPTQPAERRALLAQSETIRRGLLNAYLARYRYLSSWHESNNIEMMYRDVFKLPENIAKQIQMYHNQFLSPFLYQNHFDDTELAEKQYEFFFDEPIQRREHQAIKHAIESTWDREEAKAGLLNVSDRKVWLREQRATLQDHGDWADVELYEAYENQTPRLQEVFYSFTLPESAVVTGVWLGNTANLNDRYPYVVAPRGAAQQVYTEQVREQVDPALLEQVGPRQYRLRAFPIPIRNGQANQPQELHLWLTYKVMRQAEGFPLPQLAEKRNVYWNQFSKRTLVDQPMQQSDWLPAYVNLSQGNQTGQPIVREIALSESDRIVAKPLTSKDYRLPQNKRYAIVLDTSYSMNRYLNQLRDAFQTLKSQGMLDSDLKNNDADLYLTATGQGKPQRLDEVNQFDVSQFVGFGSLQFKDLLNQFAQLRGNTAYDGVLVLTDQGSYELSDDQTAVATIITPVWMVHLGGIASAYDDKTLKVLQDSRGGMAATVQEALQRVATEEGLGSDLVSVTDGYAWFWQKAPASGSIQSAKLANRKGFGPLAARQYVLGLSRVLQQDSQSETIEKLDRIHKVAQTYDIVTPYSSMLVLVNDEQRERLRQLENQRDRFEREVETGKETLNPPSNPLTVSGVPEPENWLLLLVGAGLLLAIKHWRYHPNSDRGIPNSLNKLG